MIRERTIAGLAAARARGRVGGRKPALTADKLAIADALLKDGRMTVSEVCKHLGIGASTLYRSRPAARSAAMVEP
jgi:DNA invertase Pin-like site-specific DNA recombinase